MEYPEVAGNWSSDQGRKWGGAPVHRPGPCALTRCQFMTAGLDIPMHTVNLAVLEEATMVCWLAECKYFSPSVSS